VFYFKAVARNIQEKHRFKVDCMKTEYLARMFRNAIKSIGKPHNKELVIKVSKLTERASQNLSYDERRQLRRDMEQI